MKSSYSHLKCCLKRNPNGHNSISRNLASPRKFPQSPWPHHTNKTRQRLWTHTFFLLLYNTQEHCLSFVHCTYALDSVLSVCVNAICTKSCAQVFVSTASILPLAWAHFDVSLLCKTRRSESRHPRYLCETQPPWRRTAQKPKEGRKEGERLRKKSKLPSCFSSYMYQNSQFGYKRSGRRKPSVCAVSLEEIAGHKLAAATGKADLEKCLRLYTPPSGDTNTGKEWRLRTHPMLPILGSIWKKKGGGGKPWLTLQGRRNKRAVILMGEQGLA